MFSCMRLVVCYKQPFSGKPSVVTGTGLGVNDASPVFYPELVTRSSLINVNEGHHRPTSVHQPDIITAAEFSKRLYLYQTFGIDTKIRKPFCRYIDSCIYKTKHPWHSHSVSIGPRIVLCLHFNPSSSPG